MSEKNITKRQKYTISRNVQYVQIKGSKFYAVKLSYELDPTMIKELDIRKEFRSAIQGVSTKKEIDAFLQGKSKAIAWENIIVTTEQSRKKSRQTGEDPEKEKLLSHVYDKLLNGDIKPTDLYIKSYESGRDMRADLSAPKMSSYEYTNIVSNQKLAQPIRFAPDAFNDTKYNLTKLVTELYFVCEKYGISFSCEEKKSPSYATPGSKKYLSIQLIPSDELMTKWLTKAAKQNTPVYAIAMEEMEKELTNSKKLTKDKSKSQKKVDPDFIYG